jgi:hypothetical protein
METLVQANSRRSRLLNRPAQLVTEIVRLSPIHGLGVFAGPEGSPARSVLEFVDGVIWYTLSFRVFTAGGFNIPLGNLSWFTSHRMDSFILQPNGQYLPSANNINAPLQFGQLLEDHPNHLRPPGISLRDWIIYCSRSNCIFAGFMDAEVGLFRVIAETVRDLPPHGEWIGPYNPHRRSVGDPNYLVDPEVFDWNNSTPAAQAEYMLHSLQDNRFDLDDVALLAVDFVRRDYRDLTQSTPLSIWLPYFVGLYARQGSRVRCRDYWTRFLARPEIRVIEAWTLLWEWAHDMGAWTRLQLGRTQGSAIGEYYSSTWWSSFETAYENNRVRPAQPHPHGYSHPVFGNAGTGYDPTEQPYGMPALESVSYTTFH